MRDIINSSKETMLTTTDGFELKVGDTYYVVFRKSLNIKRYVLEENYVKSVYLGFYFASLEEANEYRLMNMNLISLSDLVITDLKALKRMAKSRYKQVTHFTSNGESI